MSLISSGLLVTSPVYPVSESCLVLPCPALVFIKDYYLSLRPHLRVPVPPSCVHRDNFTALVERFIFLEKIWHVLYLIYSISKIIDIEANHKLVNEN